MWVSLYSNSNLSGSLSTMKGVHCPKNLRKCMKCTESKIEIHTNKSL